METDGTDADPLDGVLLRSSSVELLIESIPNGHGKEGATSPALHRDDEDCKRRLLLAGVCQEHDQAKAEVTLQTMRAILGLSHVSTWGDIVEQTESLVQRARSSGQAFDDPEIVADAVASAREEAWQADLECERLEEKLTAEVQRTQQLRDILQKQQHLLDMTAGQIERQNQDQKQRDEAFSALEVKEQQQRTNMIDQEERIGLLMDELATYQQELENTTSKCTQQEQDLQAAVGQIAHLEVQLQNTQQELSARDTECASLKEDVLRYSASAEQNYKDAEQLGAECRELKERLMLQEDHFEKLRMELQVHEAEKRRKNSYRTGPLSSRGTASLCSLPRGTPGADDDALSAAGTDYSIDMGTARSSGRLHSGYSSVSATPRLGNRGTSSSATADMTNEERDAFLSHFPMASRTERVMRDRLEERRRTAAISNPTSAR